MNYLKELKKDNSVSGWNVNVGDWNLGDQRTFVFEFFEELTKVYTTEKITWISPGSLKHLIEYYSRNGGGPGKINYCCRDLCTAMAIVYGLPVKLKENANDNEIGLHFTKRQFSNLYHNIANNNGAWDLENALVSPHKFRLTDWEHEALYCKYPGETLK